MGHGKCNQLYVNLLRDTLKDKEARVKQQQEQNVRIYTAAVPLVSQVQDLGHGNMERNWDKKI